MPTLQVKISPLADSHVVRWKGIKGYAHKSEAMSDLLERVDIDALLKEKTTPRR